MTKHPTVKHSVINITMHKVDAFYAAKRSFGLNSPGFSGKKKRHIMLKIIQNQYHQSASSLAA